jgi:hypothetical protein
MTIFHLPSSQSVVGIGSSVFSGYFSLPGNSLGKKVPPRKFWSSSLLSRLCSAGSFDETIVGFALWRWFLQFVVCLCYLNFSQYFFFLALVVTELLIM